MSVKQLQKRKRLRKGRITYRKRKQKLTDGKIIEQFYEVGSETDVSIDCPLFELPPSISCQEMKDAILPQDFLSKMCVTKLTASKDVISRLEELKFVEYNFISEKVESENEDLGHLDGELCYSKSSKRKRIMNKRKTVSDSLFPSDTESNEEYPSVETDLFSTEINPTTSIKGPDPAPYRTPVKYSYSSLKVSQTDINTKPKMSEITNLDADDEESTFESIISKPEQTDATMRDLPAHNRMKDKRNLLRDPELVNSIITQFVESSQNQLAISTRIDKFGFRVIRCLSLAHGVKVKLLEHCHFGWCPLLLRTARSRVGEKELWEPMLNLLKQESKGYSRKSKSRHTTS
ncbi:hypothetical protein LOD99_4318 [Oopsacas minuta]|uniref:Uncharacterized protein n=1 Tax=Oopsacas minuta TaxID=111878 RepID=A0AAV7JUA7_9METZ|nr:hypothetical protein LOD99_4318 [Oopsacas minuta]